MSNIVNLPRKQQRLSVNINKQTEDALRTYAQRRDVSITEAVRRHVGVAEFILAAIADGGEILVRKHGDTERVTFDLT